MGSTFRQLIDQHRQRRLVIHALIASSVGLTCKLMPTIERPSNENHPFSLDFYIFYSNAK